MKVKRRSPCKLQNLSSHLLPQMCDVPTTVGEKKKKAEGRKRDFCSPKSQRTQKLPADTWLQKGRLLTLCAKSGGPMGE